MGESLNNRWPRLLISSKDMQGVLADLAEDVADKYEYKRDVDNYAVNSKSKSEWGHLNKNFRSFWHNGMVYINLMLRVLLDPLFQLSSMVVVRFC